MQKEIGQRTIAVVQRAKPLLFLDLFLYDCLGFIDAIIKQFSNTSEAYSSNDNAEQCTEKKITHTNSCVWKMNIVYYIAY